MSVDMGVTVQQLTSRSRDLKITLVLESWDDLEPTKAIRRQYIEEYLSEREARRCLSDLRDLADRALRKHWPNDRPKGRHEKGIDDV